MSGKIYFCGTPIGNLEDITLRVLNVLRSCHVVYAEDTRHSIRLLNHFEISKPLHSYHEHNRLKVGPEIIEKAMNGDHVAMVTDAGMPGISDPGQDLIQLCIDENVPFEIVPGVTAFTTALVGSGLSTERFAFEGFLAREKRKKKDRLEKLCTDDRTLIFYESPHRLKQTLKSLLELLGNRKAVVARELTKRYETYQRGRLSELIDFYEDVEVKGEIVLLVEGNLNIEDHSFEMMSTYDHVVHLMNQGMTKKEAMKQVAQLRGIKKSDVYAEMLENE